MKLKKLIFMSGLLGLALWAGGFGSNPIYAETEETDKVKELERKINILAEEIDRLKSVEKKGKDIHRPKGRGHDHGLEGEWGGAPAASKVYEASEGKTTFGGYGELHYNNAQSSPKADELDLHRIIFYFGHRFNDWIVFNSELEVEHAGDQGEISLEQAYLDFFLAPYFNIRTGLVLIPMGIINEIHEPPTFNGVDRPEVEKYILPSTWRENGIGIFGKLEYGFQYRFYLVNGGDISNFSKPSNGIRQTRQKGFPAKATDLAFTGRLDYTGFLGLRLGASFYAGDSSQEENNSYGRGRIMIWSTDARFNWKGVEFRGLYARGTVSDTDKINTESGMVMGKSFYGFYGEIAYNIFSLFDTTHHLAPFVRYEQFDTQESVASGYVRDPANERTTITVGLTYKPIPDVAIKGDYQFKSNGANADKDDYINLGVGYMF